MLASAINKTGINEIWETVLSFENQTKLNGFFKENRAKQKLNWFHKTLKNKIISDYYSQKNTQIKQVEKDILLGNVSPFDAEENSLAFSVEIMLAPNLWAALSKESLVLVEGS